MSKTFKSALGTTELEVVKYSDSIGALFIRGEDGEDLAGFYFDQTSVPAQALAVLEAAGVADRRHWNQDVEDGTDVHLEFIAKHLADYIKAQERATAEARELAELEAEALELFQASCLNGETLPSFERYPDIKLKWFAVARRAREMRAEK